MSDPTKKSLKTFASTKDADKTISSQNTDTSTFRHEFHGFSSFQNSPDQLSGSDSLFFSPPKSRSTHWSIAWSDLMMTMFVLFMVMFIYKSADREFLSGEGLGFSGGRLLGNEISETKTMGANNYFQYADKSVARIYDFSRQLIDKKELKDFASIDLEADKTLRIVLTGDLLFDSGNVNLKTDAEQNLVQIANALRYTPYMINVIGHTDNLPVGSAYASNWELSVLRASSVARFLISKTGLPPNQFYVTGHSLYQPVVPNSSDTNRAKNRRVEIVLTKLLPLQETSLTPQVKKEFAAETQTPGQRPRVVIQTLSGDQ